MISDIASTLQVGDVTPVVEGMFEDFNGIPFPQFFGQKESFKQVGFWEKVGWNMRNTGAAIWAYSPLNMWSVLMEMMGGDYASLGFLKKMTWIFYRLTILNYHMGVYQRNTNFLFWKDLAAAASAAWFKVFFWWSFFLRMTANDVSYDHDFDDIDARGLDYSLSQATSYHYWEGKEAHPIGKMFYVNYIVDSFQLLIFGLPLLVMGPAYFIWQILYVFLLPSIWAWKLLTPWEEKEGETPIMWWVGALELGLYDPRDPPTNFWEIEDARTQYLSKFKEDEEKKNRRGDD